MKVDNRQIAIAWWPLSTVPLERAPLYSITSSASPLYRGLCVLSHFFLQRPQGPHTRTPDLRGVQDKILVAEGCSGEEVTKDAGQWVRG